MIGTLTLADIAALCDGELRGDDAEVLGFSKDTRTLNSGDLYIALRGEQFDGHSFCGKAAEMGAVGLLVDHFDSQCVAPQVLVSNTLLALGLIAAENRRRFQGKVLGLTGSVGKTTVKEMLASVLSQAGKTLATEGNLNNEIGVPFTLLRLADEDFAVIEMGAGKEGDIAYLNQFVKPDLALVTTVAASHLDGFGDVATIARTKAEIYSGRNNEGSESIAVINADNEYTRPYLSAFADQPSISFSADSIADVYAQGIQAQNAGLGARCYSFQLCFLEQKECVSLQIPGLHMVGNALAAAASCVALGLPLQQIAKGLSAASAFSQRMESFDLPAGGQLIDDSYNANPASMCAAIDVLSTMPLKRVLVMGKMAELGSESEALHAQVGDYAGSKELDALFAVGGEAAHAAEAFAQRSPESLAKSFTDLESCLAALNEFLNQQGAQASVLIKGSRSAGMEYIVRGLNSTSGNAH